MIRGLEFLARRPGLLVLGYHRIGISDAARGYAGVFSATADEFRDQIRYLKGAFRVVSLDEVIAAGPGLALRNSCVMITFDDGYRDSLDVAVPILKQLGVPATYFLPTDFLDQPRLFWWDRLAITLHRTTVEKIGMGPPLPIEIDFRRESPDAAIARAVGPLLDADPAEIEPWLDRLERHAEVRIASEDEAGSLLIGWQGARELLQEGMSVGSHARSHRNLARLDPASQRDELVGSKSRLESELGSDVTALAYPYGVNTAFTPSTCQIARESGYQLAFGFEGGINRPGKSRQFAMARVNVGSADSLNLFRSRAVFLSTFGESIF